MRNDRQDTLFAIFAVLLILSALFFLYLRISDKPGYSRMEYIVQDGDTLDGLYYRYGGGNLEKWRYLVREENGMVDSRLYSGDKIIVLKGDGATPERMRRKGG